MSREIILPGGEKLDLFDSAYTGQQVEDLLARLIPGGGIATSDLADGAVTWPKLAVDARPIRRNLLRNAYFVGGGSQQGGGQFPINSRGKVSYSITSYDQDANTIDGWIYSINCGVSIEADAISLTRHMVQRIENVDLLVGRELTFSVLTSTGDLYSGSAVLNELSQDTDFIVGGSLRFSSFWKGFQIQGNLRLTDAKLEVGPDQTLAHKGADGKWVRNGPPPNFGLELLKCQRYFQTFATQSLRPTKGADFRPVMRTDNPTLGTITLPDGTVLYTASSEL